MSPGPDPTIVLQMLQQLFYLYNTGTRLGPPTVYMGRGRDTEVSPLREGLLAVNCGWRLRWHFILVLSTENSPCSVSKHLTCACMGNAKETKWDTHKLKGRRWVSWEKEGGDKRLKWQKKRENTTYLYVLNCQGMNENYQNENRKC